MSRLKSRTKRQSLPRESFSSQTLVSRLMGMETEYAVLMEDASQEFKASQPSAKRVYHSLLAVMQMGQPSAPGLDDGEQHFFANGCSISLETSPDRHDMPGGLFEMATPEMHQPSDVVASQRCMDQMMEDAAERCDLPSLVRVLKNSRDGQGNLYGCQENYEAVVATGVWLLIYRLCISFLWIMQIATAFLSVPLILTVVAIACCRAWWEGSLRAIHHDTDELYKRVPPWLSRMLLASIRVAHLPLAWVVRFIGNHVAFRSQRRHLTSLLISRIVLSGAGELDLSGRFFVSSKAMGIDRISDIGGFHGERPIFVHGHWFRQLCVRSWENLWRTNLLFRRRQRLQIGLSDSNMSELAEYVKVGSVSLVLDMIEAGETSAFPRVKRPLDALQRMARDWHLVTRVPTSQGELSALEIQQRYFKAAKKFVEGTSANVRGEAPRVLSAWQKSLDAVAAYRRDADDVQRAMGRVDWLTKRWLMDRQADDGNSAAENWSQQKKIDLRYHELSDEGYFRQITLGGQDTELVPQEQRRQRKHAPPSNTPAARRAWTIREFAHSGANLRLTWGHAEVDEGRRRRKISFGNQAF